ncbi:MAG: hypothetical protein R2781_03575 [Flavobacteriaceae bacterium]
MNNPSTILDTIIDFLNSIPIKIIEKKISHDTFLPGIQLCGSSIYIDREKLKYPGDLLHEAGHIAVTEASVRPLIGKENQPPNWPSDGEEIAAILWSFAASHHLQLSLDVVFHPNGYKNEATWLIEQFSSKNYMGLPLLEWMNLCNKEEFPKMIQWVR